MSNKKWDIEKARKLFKDNGCELLEYEYINNRTKMRYICSCDSKEEAKITLCKFRQGQRCKKCYGKRISVSKRRTLKEVKKIFKDGGCELVEKKYINNMTKMEYLCDCGRTAWISLAKFKKGQRCKKCGIEKRADKRRYTIKQVREIFRKGGCKLVSKIYKSCSQKLEYICNCKRFAKITLSEFKSGRRCMLCGIEKISGKNHYNYNHNLTDEERIRYRKCPGYSKWRKDVYKRDNYTCQICGETEEKLCAHHIESYTSNEKLRVVVSNGILMCESYHKLFHKLYGNGNNTTAQFEEFLEKYQEILIS